MKVVMPGGRWREFWYSRFESGFVAEYLGERLAHFAATQVYNDQTQVHNIIVKALTITAESPEWVEFGDSVQAYPANPF